MDNDRPYLIAGIDPGTTTGIAILDFNGELLNLFSSKDLSLDKVIKHLTGFGKVSLIAVDVKPAPGFVPKLATRLGSETFLPEEPLSVNEKVVLTREYRTENSHQRDALASALTAFNRFKNKFAKIDSLGLGDEVKDLVLHGVSINDAVEILNEGEEEEATEFEEEKPARIPSLEEIMISRLEKQNSILRGEIQEREKGILELKKELVKVKESYRLSLRKDMEIEKRDDIIKKLKKHIIGLEGKLDEIERLKGTLRKLAGGKIKAVGIFPEIYDGLSIVRKKPRGRELSLVDDVEISFIENKEIGRELERAGILTAEASCLKEVSGFFYISESDLRKIRKSKRMPLQEIVRNYRAGRG